MGNRKFQILNINIFLFLYFIQVIKSQEGNSNENSIDTSNENSICKVGSYMSSCDKNNKMNSKNIFLI